MSSQKIYCIWQPGEKFNAKHHGWLISCTKSLNDRNVIRFSCNECLDNNDSLHDVFEDTIAKLSVGSRVNCLNKDCYGFIKKILGNRGNASVYIECANHKCIKKNHSVLIRGFLREWEVTQLSSPRFYEGIDDYWTMDDIQVKGDGLTTFSLAGDLTEASNSYLGADMPGYTISGGFNLYDNVSISKNADNSWSVGYTGENNVSVLKVDNNGAEQRIYDAITDLLNEVENVTVLPPSGDGKVYGWVDDEELDGSPVPFQVSISSSNAVEQHVKTVMNHLEERDQWRQKIAELSEQE